MSEIATGGAHHVHAEPWTGRDDGPGPEHSRWWNTVSPAPLPRQGSVALVGFASDEGVRRNHGRVGAFDGPRAIRAALGSLAFHHDVEVVDLGDVVVAGHDLERGQAMLGEVAGPAVASGATVILGGGHETAFGTFLALQGAGYPRPGRRLSIINLDAHFDLREADRPTSGTPFRQMADALGDDFHYAVVGISEPNNTRALVDAADRLGVAWLPDERCDTEAVLAFLDPILAGSDDVYLTIDLDVLPASVAPGVSAPAALGVPLATIVAAVRRVAGSGKLRVADVVEYNPSLDIDARTARVAARLVDTIVGESAGQVGVSR